MFTSEIDFLQAGLIKHRRESTGLGGEGKRATVLTPTEERICALMGEVTYAGKNCDNARVKLKLYIINIIMINTI